MTTFFWDKNIGTSIPEALRLLNPPSVSIMYYLEEYPGSGAVSEEGDHHWLRDVGVKGWFVISKDRRITRRPAELLTLREYSVGYFFFSQANEPRWETFRCFVRAFDQIMAIASSEPRPFAFRINWDGSLTRVAI